MPSLTDQSMRRLAEAVRRAERDPLTGGIRKDSRQGFRAPVVQVVKVTSTIKVTVDGRSYYPGQIQQYDHAAGAWSVVGDCYVLDANAP